MKALVALVMVGVMVGGASGGKGVHVCVGKDRILRHVPGAPTCPAGEQSFDLAEVEPEKAEVQDDTEAQLALLEKRLAALEKASRGGLAHRIGAPFEVVDRTGKVLLRVAEGIDAVTGDGARVTIGAANNGTYGINVYDDGKLRVAGLGQSRLGGGAMVVADDKGAIRAAAIGHSGSITAYNGSGVSIVSLGDLQGKGSLVIWNGENVVAALSTGARGGGLLQLSDPGGTPMVEAGTVEGGFGVVRTGPMSVPAPGLFGIPGSFIKGRVK